MDGLWRGLKLAVFPARIPVHRANCFADAFPAM
jgi:hypothetical protein